MADADRLNEAEMVADVSRLREDAKAAVDAWDVHMKALDGGDTEAKDRAMIALSGAMFDLRRAVERTR